MKMFSKCFPKKNKNLVRKKTEQKVKLLFKASALFFREDLYKFVDFMKKPFLKQFLYFSFFEAGLTQLCTFVPFACPLPWTTLSNYVASHSLSFPLSLSLSLSPSLSLLQYICVSLKQHIVNWLTKKFVSLQGFQSRWKNNKWLNCISQLLLSLIAILLQVLCLYTDQIQMIIPSHPVLK